MPSLAPLKASAIYHGIDGLKEIMRQVAEYSNPYKEEVTFVKVQCGIVTCVRNDEIVRINSRHIYAGANQLVVGETFCIDVRYIQSSLNSQE